MLTKLLHRVVAHPSMYELVQTLGGSITTRRVLSAQIVQFSNIQRIFDLGGGTGLYRGLWPSGCSYTCLDLDVAKLRGFANRYPRDSCLLADATQIPCVSGSIDVVTCLNVSHHLPEAVFVRLIGESHRVLKPGGAFVFLDAIWPPANLAARLLWQYDRGSYPHTWEYLVKEIAKCYAIGHREYFSIWHRYLLCVGITECQ